MLRSSSAIGLLLLTIVGVGLAEHCPAQENAVGASDFEKSLVVRWEFSTEETTPLKSVGSVQRDKLGPRAPEFPEFGTDNTAISLDGSGARMEFDDPGPDSLFDFSLGDELTIEAWVQPREIRAGAHAYIVGKGRTQQSGFPRDNQNWAMRLSESNSRCVPSFLFATQRDGAEDKSHWHRWMSTSGFAPGPAWHHVAVSYRFGEPDSIRCWLDGQPQKGTWDMGGATKAPPVVDDDAIWIGSSQGGASGNSFHGSLDSVAVYRQMANNQIMASRYPDVQRERPISLAAEVFPDMGPLSGAVQCVLHEGMPSHVRWLNEDESIPVQTTHFPMDAFLLDRLPLCYDEWGIRGAWQVPVLVRIAADVPFPVGEQELMMRVRGLSRLWVDGHIVARSEPIKGSPSGEEPLTPIAIAPAPGARIAEHRQQEVFGKVAIQRAGRHRVVLETIVGGKGHRVDPGETCVAWFDPDSRYWKILSDREESFVALQDRAVLSKLAETEQQFVTRETTLRRQLAASQDDYWERRHADARRLLAEESVALAAALEESGRNPIDYFLNQRARELRSRISDDPETGPSFYEKVAPILQKSCFRCHDERMQGGLRLDDKAAYLEPSDSGESAIVPFAPEQSELLRRISTTDDSERMPPSGAGLSEQQIATVREWIESGAKWPEHVASHESIEPADTIGDAAFLRRLALDTVGINPTEQELRDFMADSKHDKRQRAVDRYLHDERWADHWVSYWQDVLAENPTLINASLNTTGPFRWFLYEALLDNKPIDRWVSELIMMRGSPFDGGSAGFGIAGDNDAPSAAKGQILASAFLGMEMQCARCHDAPYHNWLQKDLYSLAAMLDQKTIPIPQSSRVPAEFFASRGRRPLIQATVGAEEMIAPEWPFTAVPGVPSASACAQWVRDPNSPREVLAVCVTSPANQRFAKVIVNRVWQRLIGTGLVEPVDDWDGAQSSHPELLQWLADELVRGGYDLKRLSRWILTSELYQRESVGRNVLLRHDVRFLKGPDVRRLTGEQILDTLVAGSGRPMDVEELTFDPDGRRPASNRLTLGVPRRAWMLANLANERDRPSLGLPKAQLLSDVLIAFGWSGARQNPRTIRESEPNIIQPGVMSSSPAVLHLTRAVYNSGLSELAIRASTPSELVDSLFHRYLARPASSSELELFTQVLAPGFSSREQEMQVTGSPETTQPLPRITWSNHLNPEINETALRLAEIARRGPAVDPRLDPLWRERYEDVVWSIVNLSEFVWYP